MNIGIILVISLMVFIGVRIFFIFFDWILSKIFRSTADNAKLDLVTSISFYLIYIAGFLGTVSGVAKNNPLNDVEWYSIYTFIGISSMVWCYFSWDLKLKAKPIFGLNDKKIIIKKIVIFFIVMLISFANGYGTMYKEFYKKDVFPEIRVLNATMIVGIIAFDRLLNQVVNFQKLKLKEQTQK